MTTLGLLSPPPERRPAAWRLGLEYAVPFVAFAVSIPPLLASLPAPRFAEDYLVVGSTATFVAMIAALFLITRRQMQAVERSHPHGRK